MLVLVLKFKSIFQLWLIIGQFIQSSSLITKPVLIHSVQEVTTFGLNAQLRNLILTLYTSYLPLWMGPLPAGECIGWEPAVYKGQMGLIVGVTQVLEVAPQLTSVQLTLQ